MLYFLSNLLRGTYMIANLLAASFDSTQFTVYRVLSIIGLVLVFLTALVTIVIVLFQKSNSDGITASSETFFGKNRGQSIEAKLKKWTWICLGVLAFLSIAIYIVGIIVQ